MTKEKKNFKYLHNNWKTLTDKYQNRNKVINSIKVKNPYNFFPKNMTQSCFTLRRNAESVNKQLNKESIRIQELLDKRKRLREVLEKETNLCQRLEFENNKLHNTIREQEVGFLGLNF